ncbi:MAG: efflux RND transporter periplasmic adaptor subunit [Deltaproteobacteria bacterium]|jgi:Cu(I)/Ag(I) efflux system membrane fusion protein|nr:efflux RND transporter periplasmic adaptor subunit [Deltaproteobacteria bacterium]
MLPKYITGLVIGFALGAGLVWLGGNDAGGDRPRPEAAATETPGGGEPGILYWYDPMYPGEHFDGPGKSPFMDMDLIPRYAGGGAGLGVAIDPVMVQNLGLRTAQAKAGNLVRVREVSAAVEFNRYLEARVQPRAEGFVTSVAKLAVGDTVTEGQEIARITVPAWASDQSEYLLLKNQRADPKLIGGVREKLRLSGMPEEMLAEVDATGKVQTSLRILSPVTGAVTALDVYPGMNAEKNMTVAVIQGYDPVWVTAEVPEADLALALGGRARVTLAAWPGEVFEATERAVLAKANGDTRTVPLRLTVPNPDGRLKPGLTAGVRLRGPGPEGLIIPTQGLIDLGEEKRVITVATDGSFLPRKVTVGGSSGGETVVTDGLSEGDTVVVTGLFLIDSEANLTGALERMRRPAPPAAGEK